MLRISNRVEVIWVDLIKSLFMIETFEMLEPDSFFKPKNSFWDYFCLIKISIRIKSESAKINSIQITSTRVEVRNTFCHEYFDVYWARCQTRSESQKVKSNDFRNKSLIFIYFYVLFNNQHYF